MMYETEGNISRRSLKGTHPGQPGACIASRTSALEVLTFASGREQTSATQVSLRGLLANQLLAALPGEDFARLLPYLVPVSLSSGEDLYEFGESTPYAYFPETAVISHLHIMSDGEMTEAELVGREGMVGLSAIFNLPQPAYLTQAAVPGTALRVKTEFLRMEFARGGALQRLLLGYVGERISQLSQRAVCNGRHRVEKRLCSWLLMVHDRAGEDLLPLTHEQIANHLGVRRAGVTEAVTALRKKRIINSSRGQLRVLDREALEAGACECYRTLGRTVGQNDRLRVILGCPTDGHTGTITL
jgi:CRP-like cAMP-binding protein